MCSRCGMRVAVFFFFKQKTAYEMRISDWSSDVCSSDLPRSPRNRVDDPRRGEHDHHANYDRDEHLHRRAAEEPQKANDDDRDDRKRAEQTVAQQAENVVGQAFKVCLRKSRLRYEQADRKSTRLNSSH